MIGMKRVYHLEGIRNFRDLGGYETPYGETSYGVVYRGGELSKIDQKGVDALAKMGIKTVLDLRDERFYGERPDRTLDDPRFVNLHVVVSGNGRVPTSRQDGLASYDEMVEEKESAARVWRAILASEKPLYLHCAIGKDRTGVFAFLLLLANGVCFDDANGDYLLSFAYIADLAEEVRAGRQYFPADLIAGDELFMLDWYRAFLKRHGTLRHYFEEIGLSQDEINLLCNLLGKREKSCGAVVLNQEGQVLVEEMALGHLSIPKGHVEVCDKDEEDTARREIREETGFEVSFIPGFRYHIAYSPYPGIAKDVYFFLASIVGGEQKAQLEEVKAIRFLPFNEAEALVTHQSDKEVLAQAEAFLKRR